MLVPATGTIHPCFASYPTCCIPSHSVCWGIWFGVHDDVLALRNQRLKAGLSTVAEELQGVSAAKMAVVLSQVALGGNADIVDGEFAFLDDETPSWFPKPPERTKVADGATTVHLACHIGILQRGGGKLDREGARFLSGY